MIPTPQFTASQLESIEEGALQILQSHGIAVRDELLVERLRTRGLSPSADGRVRLERAMVRRYVDHARAEGGNRFSVSPSPAPADERRERVTMDCAWYATHVHDLERDEIVPLTSEALVETLKLVHVLRGRGISSTWVGNPQDVPAALRPVMTYWLAGMHLESPEPDGLIQSLASQPYELEMAAALGHPMNSATVFCLSPLTLAGESVQCAIQRVEALERIHIGSMPASGSTAPLPWGNGFALSAAEVIGGAVLMGEALGVPTAFGLGLFSSDMRSLVLSFGSPESAMLQALAAQVDGFFHGTPWRPAVWNALTCAAMPGAQACAERASALTLGASWGSRHFTGAGILGLDEVFSAEQLVYDLDIKGHTERLLRSDAIDADPERLAGDVAQALAEGSFAGADSTVDGYRAAYWTPDMFQRHTLGGWRAAGEMTARARAREVVRRLVDTYEYQPPRELRADLDGILGRARDALT